MNRTEGGQARGADPSGRSTPDDRTRPAIRWDEAYARLERARRALEAGREPGPDARERILRERARALARPLDKPPTAGEVLDLLVFSLAGERYGIETARVMEVVRLRGLTAVPCTPPFVLGVVHHRGRILAVLDLRRLLELAGQGVAEGSRAVVVEARGIAFGILTDAVAGIVRVAAGELTPLPVTSARQRQPFVRGVTGELVAVLDLEALAQDPRITVKEEVG